MRTLERRAHFIGTKLDVSSIASGDFLTDESGRHGVVTLAGGRHVKSVSRGNGEKILESQRYIGHFNSETGVWGSKVKIYWPDSPEYQLKLNAVQEAGL